ncbi:hypothetical protein [Streptomyces sp. NPDC052036]|uniref:hypothetical protein n=1 Tax=Streptomyces sp. NPDC052036 TaxID=3155171 RepID=UPI00344ABF49
MTINVSEGVATVTIDHPPLNLMDAVRLPSLRAFIARAMTPTSASSGLGAQRYSGTRLVGSHVEVWRIRG